MVPLFCSESCRAPNGCFKWPSGAVKGLNRMNKRAQMDATLNAEEVWPGAFLAAELLVSQPNLVAGKRVLEVGAGQHALPSLVAASMGASVVLATDHPDSGILSTLPPILELNDLHNTVQVACLDWVSRALHRAPPSPPSSSSSSCFDFIIAAECLWKDTVPLHSALACVVTGEARVGARLLVTWGDRLCDGHGAQDNRVFVDLLVAQHGWHIERDTETLETDMLQEGGGVVVVHVVLLCLASPLSVQEDGEA